MLATFTWTSPVSGAFNNPAMWTGPGGTNGVPGSGDDAVTPSGTYTISVTGNTTVNSLNGGAMLDVTSGVFDVTNTVNTPNSTIGGLSVASGASFTSSSQTTTIDGSVMIAGTVNVPAGTLVISGGGSDSGQFNIPTTAGAIEITGAGYNLNAGATFTGAGTLELNAGGGAGGTGVNINSGLTIPNVSISDGTIQGPGSLTVPGTLAASNGAYDSLSGTLTLPAGSTLALAGTNTTTFNNTTVNVVGTTTMSAHASFALLGSTVFSNSGTFTITNDDTNGGGLFDLNTGTFNNTGMLIKASALGPVGYTVINGGNFNNTGTVSVTQGQLQFGGNVTSTGDLATSTGGTLLFAGTVNLNAGTTLTGAGTFEELSGTINVNANIPSTNFTIINGTLTVDASSTFSVTGLTFNTGKIVGPGTVAIPTGGTVAFTTDADKSLSGVTLSISGTANWAEGAGNIDLAGGAVIDVNAGATFNSANDQNINGSSTETVNVAGTFVKTSAGGLGTTSIGATTNVEAGGLISLISGNLSTGSLTDIGTILLDPQTTLNVSGTYTQTSAGTLNVAVRGAPSTSQFGQLKATSTGTLGGTLNATLANGFVPTSGQSFPIMTFSSRSGNFANFNPPKNGNSALFTVGLASNAVNLVVPAPAAPTGLAIDPADDTNGPGSTSNHQPRLTGQAAPGIAVQIYQNGQFVGGATTGSNGTFVITPTTTLATGSYTFIAVAVSGSVYSPYSTPLKVAITVPSPTGLAIYPADDTGGPNATSNHLPRLTGQATPGILVQVYNQNQQYVGGAITGSNGTFVITPTAPLATGSDTFTAVAVDSLGNYSPGGTPLKVTITPPAAPTGLAIIASEVTGGLGVTSFHEPTITGQATPGIAVQIYQNGHFVAAAVANASGTFTATATTALSPGTYPMIAVAVDQYGNYGLLSAALSVTVTPPPAAPTGLTIDPADDNDGSNKTTLTQPRLTGTAQAGLLVQIYDSLGNYIGGAIANSAGTFVITPVAKLSLGIHILKAVAIDAGGNYGGISTPYSLSIA